MPIKGKKGKSRASAHPHRTGGRQRTHPVFSIVVQASIALCRSIRRWVIGTGGRGGTQLKVRTLFQVADVDTGVINWVNADLVTHIVPRV